MIPCFIRRPSLGLAGCKTILDFIGHLPAGLQQR